MELSGRVALVTGAASGIGRATVEGLAKAGISGVAINYRAAKSEAEELAGQLQRAGVEALAVQADVRSDAQVRAMIARVEKHFSRLDILVNNAGTTRWIPVSNLEELTDEVWDEIFDVNLKGAFRCIRAAAPLLAKTRGMIVNVASIAGILAPSTMSSLAYGAAKAALIHATRVLAVALAPAVRVNAVAPAFTDTPWMRSHYGNDYESAVAGAAKTIPLGRVAAPEEIAGAIVGLVTGGDFVTGQTLIVDGGLSLT
ncbi:MAG TPA: SDR family NAD(P)-dependent oxidoreductase [Candidatus Acidoferrales bacterium]|nr:SDR family NAD(P)-dependent oxidoreductase [Candidatus Acidoferrales bacterium]